MIRTVHTAKYVLPEPGILLRNAAVHVSDPGRITRIEPWHGPPPNLETKVIDWGSAIILPGLVNAHTHLEFTDLQRPAHRPACFTDWLSILLRGKQGWSIEHYLDSTRRGVRLALASGTTLLGDISASGASWQALKQEKLRKVVFEEITAFQPERASEQESALEQRLAQVAADGLLTSGVSPHAPYSVSPELFRKVADLARRRGLRLATHVAETMPELEFLRTGRGEFRDFLVSLGALPAAWQPPACAPVLFLERLGILEKPGIMVHCNYLDPDSMARILNSGWSVVYCPRSHAYFGHAPHPVRQLLDMGINVALGTDSMTSNESLSILEEMRFLYQYRKDLKCDEVIRMATLNGAVALDFGGVLGRLRRGYWADMTVIRLPEDTGDRHVEAQILEGVGECLATIVQGEIVWTKAADMEQAVKES
jgi:cytosine/adenosine deaminase-related metal-dependent hydrolase